MNGAQILGIFLVILVVVVICSSIRVVPQAHAYVIERLGTYNTVSYTHLDVYKRQLYGCR